VSSKYTNESNDVVAAALYEAYYMSDHLNKGDDFTDTLAYVKSAPKGVATTTSVYYDIHSSEPTKEKEPPILYTRKD